MRGRAMVHWVAPGALAVLVMLPRLASPQFGLLDDGLTLETGRETIGRWSSVLALIPETGRSFPASWLVYSAVFGVVGVRPLAFFALNVAMLAGLLAVLARLVRLSGGTPLQAAVALVVFAACGPAVEAFYTLSKAEPLQMIWIGFSLLAAAGSAGEPRSTRRAGLVMLAAAASLLAYTTKETSFVLIPVSLGWVAIEWSSSGMRRPAGRFAITFAAIDDAAAAAFLLLRWRYAALPLAEGTYTRAYALAPDTLGPAVFRIAAWIVRDFAFLLPLLAAVRFVPRGSWRRPILYACVWMAGWLAVYTPWPATFAYYLLPFAFGAAVLAGTVVGASWYARGPEQPLTRRRMAWSVLVASGLLWVPAGVNAVADARVQLAVDRANADLVDFLASLPSRSHVVLNITPVNEYFFELPMHLSEIKRRPDVVVEPLARAGPDAPSSADVFVATPEMADQPRPTVRIAPHNRDGRGDNAMNALLSGRSDLVYRAGRHTRVLELGIHRLLCHLPVSPRIDATYCPSDRGVIYRQTFSYGWQVHRLARPAAGRVQRPT